MFGISTFSEVPYSSLASSTFNGIAAINGSANVTVSASMNINLSAWEFLILWHWANTL